MEMVYKWKICQVTDYLKLKILFYFQIEILSCKNDLIDKENHSNKLQ